MIRMVSSVVCGVLATAAVAQENVQAKSGEEVRAGWIGIVRKDCTTSAPPKVKPIALAEHGQIRLAKATVRTNSVPACPGVEVPAIVVFYKSRPSYTGVDRFTLQVGNGTDASERHYDVRVE
ncbi:hypothetical protein [Aurantimonas sp. VKM B-3413]|uniref:hypothetical protein n=1 Tax=Aurantimonas sp. VKM B-3413 TaxID=2779401 RepID=UPI001E52C016|nr:hypothetical protein [Aurantimonas sp. VKM B-3413]MCB8839374.1 hypothetical protein [Aurantimonas sp. VKM B-3413]